MATATPATYNFNPSMFTNNPEALNPVYTTSATTSNQQLGMLQDALAYLQANPNTPNASYLTNELNQQIQEQQNISNYDQAVAGQTTTGTNLSNLDTDLTNLQGMNNTGPTTTYANDPALQTYIQQLQSQGITPSSFSGSSNALADQTALQAMLEGLQSNYGTNLNTANTAVQNGLAPVLNNISLMSPNYQAEMQGVNQYYYGGNGQPGEVSQALQPVLSNLSQQNYNLKNNINSQMTAAGDFSSGVRQRALADQNAQAVGQAASDVASANSQATGQINQLNQQNQQAQAAQQNEIAGLQQQGIAGVLSPSTSSALQASTQNNQQNMQSGLTGAESTIANLSNQNNTLESVLGAAGSGLGTIGSGGMSSLFFGPQV